MQRTKTDNATTYLAELQAAAIVPPSLVSNGRDTMLVKKLQTPWTGGWYRLKPTPLHLRCYGQEVGRS